LKSAQANPARQGNLGNPGNPDWWILISVIVLTAIGVIMVFSASQYFATYAPYNDSYHFLKKHSEAAALGFLGMYIAYKMKYEWYKKLSWVVFIPMILLLIFMAASTQIESIGGAQRWLQIGGQQFQPSELSKIALPLVLAKLFCSPGIDVKSFSKGFLPAIIITGGTAGLILAQTALSSSMVVAATGFLMMYCAGVRKRFLTGTLVLGAVVVVAAIIYEPFRVNRIMAYLDPWADPTGSGWQTVQSLLALGSGGLSGVGLGSGSSKLFYLPARHTDFIFSVLGEELGFLGCIFVIVVFVLFIWRGMLVAVKMPDKFGSLLALGIICAMSIQAFINLGVVSGLLPVTGVTLPFISYGGTSLAVCLTMAGMLLNLSRYVKEDAK